MSLDLGAVIGRVILETTGFDAKYAALVRKMSMLSNQAAQSAGGVRRLDISLAGASGSATKAAAGLDKTAIASKRAATSANETAGATNRQAAGATRLAEAQARVSGVMTRTAGQSVRSRILALQDMAAQQRLAAAHSEAGSAAARQATLTARLASAQATALGASKRYAATQALSSANIAASGRKMSRAITLPIVAAGAISVHEAMQWQKSMTLIQTAGGETEAKTKQLSVGLMKIAQDTGASLDDLGEGIYTVAKAGAQKWSANEQLLVMKAAAQGAKAENVSLGVATDALSTVMLDYHLNADKAVQTENQLIRASGLAKTNFSLFSTSLSNVTPIAAALGINFAEVGGAIATMTQHGVSAQQATENLRNLMFNLAGQNNVASGAMQQLGIDTVDLAKNLGKRGLTGTLGIVDAALKAHTKNGMVTVDIHKAAALATESLDTMLGSMTGRLKDQSAGLRSGNVGIKEYTQFAKSLGGTQGASALQYLALTKNALGFSNQLRSGKGTITTTTTQYQKLLGGMTGAAVAMQINGKYAKENARNVREVGKAALEAGSDVLGWNKTSETLAVKMDKAKASLQVMAVEIGTALIPAVSKIANLFAGAAHWFSGLDSSQKHVLGWSVGILAAIGPIMAIGGRLRLAGSAVVGAASFIGSGISRTSGVVARGLGNVTGMSATSALAVQRNMSRMGAAFAGAGIGVALGSMTRGASGAAQAVGALASTAAGAAIGFQAGGPWGAAIGGGVGLLSNLAANFLGAGDAAKENVSGIDAFTAAILRDNDALGKNTAAVVANDLNKKIGDSGKSAFTFAQQLGIDPKTLTDSVLGVKAAKDKVNSILTANSRDKLGIVNPGGGARSLKVNATNAKLLGLGASRIGDTLTNEQVKKLQTYGNAAEKLAASLGAEATQTRAAKKAADDYRQATSVAGKNETARAKALKGVTAQQNAAKKSMQGLTTQVAVHGTSLNPTKKDGSVNANGASNVAALSGVLSKYKAIEQAQVASGTSTTAAAKAFDTSTAALRRQATALGFNGGKVDALIGKYKLTPKQIVTSMVANIGKATANSAQLQSVIDSIRQNKIPGLTADSKQGAAVIAALQARIDALQGTTVVATVIPDFSKLPKGTFKINAAADEAKHRNQADGSVMSFHAAGTVRENHIAQMARGGEWRVWAEDETGGESYIPHAPSKRPRSRRILEQTARILGGQVDWYAKGGITHEGDDWIYDGTKYASKRAAENAAHRGKKKNKDAAAQAVQTALGNVGQASSSPIDLSTLGYARVQRQIKHASDVITAQIRKGLTAKAERQARAQLANLRRDAEKQLTALRVKIRTSDVAAIRTALAGSADDLRGAFSEIRADLVNANASKGVLGLVDSTRNRLIKVQADIVTATERLTAMKEYRSGISDTLRGTFDTGQYASVRDFIAGTDAATGTNNSYTKEIDGLRNRVKGNKALSDLVNDLAGKGQTATLQTLAGSSASELQQVAASYSRYGSSVLAGSNAATTFKYNQSVDQQSGVLKGYTDSQKALTDLMTGVALLFPKMGNPKLTVKVGAHDVAAQLVPDPAFQKFGADLLARARRASAHGRKR